ncbi:MAG: heat-inducible transcription repressor HrcA [Armatimonadetes bacterium]|nr:heat-inducible transcription repressor HrcA [Armatimonadota bacterium]
MDPISNRQEQILQAVIVEYVTGAEPVPSETIVKKYQLGVRSATVRSELAEITELGLLDQPHTSAGRVPSDRGYRYYVDRLLVEREPEGQEKKSVRAAAEEEDTLRTLLQETTKALSRLTHLLSAAAVLRDAQLRVRSVLLTAVGPGRSLLVIVFQNGHIENRLIDCPPGTTILQLGDVNAALSRSADGQTIGSLAKAKPPSHDDAATNAVLKTAWNALKSTAKEITRGKLITEGEEYVLAQPEFQRSMDEMQSLLASIEDEEALLSAVSGEGVTIGRENKLESMHGLTILRRSFFAGEEEAGTLAIVGPKRMHYDRTLALLDYSAKAVSDALSKLVK